MKLVTIIISSLAISPNIKFSGDQHIVNFILLKFDILIVMYFFRDLSP
jgi:hypothetical protein